MTEKTMKKLSDVVGIGTTAPNQALEVWSSTTQLRLHNKGSATGKYWTIGPDVPLDKRR
jgi:hypothetical protein